MLRAWEGISRRGDHTEIAAFIDKVDADDNERERRLSAPDALTHAALWYASHGIPVFPLRPRDKAPMPGSHGFKDATTNIIDVRAWWQTNPHCNIGIPTGVAFDVIDIDGPAGFASLADMRDNGVTLPRIYGTAWTPRGGRHYYIRPSGRTNKTARTWPPGTDYRGLGGYVVVPPSIGENGWRYDWLDAIDVEGLKGGR